MNKLSYLILILLVFQIAMPTNVISQNNEKKTYYIIYDEAHGQFFNHNLLSTALKSLNESLNVNIHLIINKDKFNSTNLQTADLVIISNPGFSNTTRHTLSQIDQSETTALSSFVDLGGSILYMSNPYSTNSSISGHAKPMSNLLISSLGSITFKTSSSDADNVSLVVDDFNNDGNSSHVEIIPSNINTKVIYQEVNNFTKSALYYYGTNFNIVPANNSIVGQTAYTSYAVNQQYNLYVDSVNIGLKWMYGNEIGKSDGRAMLIGSTIMFSDYKFNNNTSWINSNNGMNLKLFQNVVAWLLKITPLPKSEPLVSQSLNFFYSSNIIFAVLAGLILIVIVYGSLLLRGRLTFDKLLAIKIGKRIQNKSKSNNSQQSSSTIKKSSGKKRSRSERRK